jgi:hypothetical protein
MDCWLGSGTRRGGSTRLSSIAKKDVEITENLFLFGLKIRISVV